MFVTVMTAFGTAALFWSDTVPSICPFKACDWAKADGVGAANRMPAAMAQIKRLERKRPRLQSVLQSKPPKMNIAMSPSVTCATETVALQSLPLQCCSRFMKRARKPPILRFRAKSGFDWVVFDVFDYVDKMFSIANVSVKRFMLPESTSTIQQFVGFVRRVRFYRMRDF